MQSSDKLGDSFDAELIDSFSCRICEKSVDDVMKIQLPDRAAKRHSTRQLRFAKKIIWNA